MMKFLFLFPFLLSAADRDWPTYGGGPEGMRYSLLTQIDRSNVAKLQVAWTFDTGEGRGDMQTQPIVVGNVLYGLTPKYRLFALPGTVPPKPGLVASPPGSVPRVEVFGGPKELFVGAP